jgi:hypothetical protein
VLQRRGSAVGYWGTLAIQAVETGFCGCLTTVSTFVAEVRARCDRLPCGSYRGGGAAKRRDGAAARADTYAAVRC